MTLVLHALRHVTGVWGGKRDELGRGVSQRRDYSGEEEEGTEKNEAILKMKGGVSLRKQRQAESRRK